MEQLLAAPHGPHCNLQMWGTPSNTSCTHVPAWTACAGLWVRARSASHQRTMQGGQHTKPLPARSSTSGLHTTWAPCRCASAPGVPANASGALFRRPCYVIRHCAMQLHARLPDLALEPACVHTQHMHVHMQHAASHTHHRLCRTVFVCPTHAPIAVLSKSPSCPS